MTERFIINYSPESVKLNMEKHNYAALMQCFLSNLNPDILTQQVNLFLESCFHSLLPFGSSQHYSEPLQGDALFPRASPLQKQSTGLFLNSPLAEGLLLKVFRALRSATRGSAPWTPQPLKRLAKLFDSGLSRIQVICCPEFWLSEKSSGQLFACPEQYFYCSGSLKLVC